MIYKGIDKWNKSGTIKHWKYIDKIKVGDTWRYFYSQAELDAFRNGSQVTTSFKNIVSNSFNFFKSKQNKQESNKTGNFVNNFFKKKVDDINKASEKVKNFVSDLFKSKEEKERERKEKEERERKEKIRAERIKAEKFELIDKNGSEDDHKYLYKVEINGKYRYFYSEEEYQSYLNRSEYVKNEPDFMLDVPRSNINYTRDEDMILVNPWFGAAEDYEINCAECSLIYELRRRGYDVESNGVDGMDYDGRYNVKERFDYLAKNAKTINVDIGDWAGEGDDGYDYDKDRHSDKYVKEYKKKVDEVFKSMPNNSRGDFSCWWDYGGGHSMVWEKDSKGNVTIYDSQLSGRGKTYTHSIEEIARYSHGPMITRTDNLEFTEEIKNIFKDRTTDLSKNKTRTEYDVKPRRRH